MDTGRTQKNVGTLRVGAARLQAVLLPVPQQLMAELHDRLPALAAARYNALSETIHEAASQLLRRPLAVDEAVERLSFLADLQVLPRCLRGLDGARHATQSNRAGRRVILCALACCNAHWYYAHLARQ